MAVYPEKGVENFGVVFGSHGTVKMDHNRNLGS